MQLCFQVNLLLLKKVAQNFRLKKRKKPSQREGESRADSVMCLTTLIDLDLPSVAGQGSKCCQRTAAGEKKICIISSKQTQGMFSNCELPLQVNSHFSFCFV